MAKKKLKFVCPDCDREIELEGLCEECQKAYATASEGEGVGAEEGSAE